MCDVYLIVEYVTDYYHDLPYHTDLNLNLYNLRFSKNGDLMCVYRICDYNNYTIGSLS